jgi:hypothetical protein
VIQIPHLNSVTSWFVCELEIDLDSGSLLVGTFDFGDRVFLETISINIDIRVLELTAFTLNHK